MSLHHLHDSAAQISLVEGETYFDERFEHPDSSDSVLSFPEYLAALLLKEEAQATVNQTFATTR
jgi:hypothetical protein